MNKSTVLLLVLIVKVVTCSDVPEGYVDNLCEEYNDGLDCCVGLVAPTPCPTSADCPTPEPSTTTAPEPCPTAPAPTPCPTFPPPTPCPTLGASVCDTCDSLTQNCEWNEGTDTLECVCQPGYVNTTEGDCAYAQLEWDYMSTSATHVTFRETDGVVDDYTMYWQVDYKVTFNMALNQDFTPLKTVAPFLVDFDNPSTRWQFPNNPTEFNNPNTPIVDFTIAELAPFDQDNGLYYLQYYLDLGTLDIASVNQIREALLDGGSLYLTMGSTVNSTDMYTYDQLPPITPSVFTTRMYYSTQERTNLGNAPCFHDAQCDLGYSTCGGFDPAFPDTPGACVCTHGALTNGVCPAAVACDLGLCSVTREVVDIGGGLYEVQCIDDIVDVKLNNPAGSTAVAFDLNAIDLKYGYSTTTSVLLDLYFSASTFAEADPIIADVLENWTLSADHYLYTGLDGFNMTANPYPFTEGFEYITGIKPAVGRATLQFKIQVGTSQLSTAQKAQLAKTIFDNGGSQLYADITVYTGAEDNRYITTGCLSNRPKIRDSDVDCYFLTETECVGGCDYSTADDIICTAP